MSHYKTKTNAIAPSRPVEEKCENCRTTEGFIERIWTDDGTKPWLCEDCAGEVRRLEKLADEWAAAPSCPERERILDTAETTSGLVKRLRAHDMAQCAECELATGAHVAANDGRARKVA
jgi:hypothetical protein